MTLNASMSEPAPSWHRSGSRTMRAVARRAPPSSVANVVHRAEKTTDAHRSDADAGGARALDRRVFSRSATVHHGRRVGGHPLRHVMAAVFAFAPAFSSPRLARRLADARAHHPGAV